jgi:hypothetical protein
MPLKPPKEPPLRPMTPVVLPLLRMAKGLLLLLLLGSVRRATSHARFASGVSWCCCGWAFSTRHNKGCRSVTDLVIRICRDEEGMCRSQPSEPSTHNHCHTQAPNNNQNQQPDPPHAQADSLLLSRSWLGSAPER